MEEKRLNSLVISAFSNIPNGKDKPNTAKKRPEKTFQVNFFPENHKVRSILAFSLEKKFDFLRKWRKDDVDFSLRDIARCIPIEKIDKSIK